MKVVELSNQEIEKYLDALTNLAEARQIPLVQVTFEPTTQSFKMELKTGEVLQSNQVGGLHPYFSARIELTKWHVFKRKAIGWTGMQNPPEVQQMKLFEEK